MAEGAILADIAGRKTEAALRSNPRFENPLRIGNIQLWARLRRKGVILASRPRPDARQPLSTQIL
jgi:hypothetical protein